MFEKTKTFGMLVVIAAVALGLFSAPVIFAQEHPEHPTKAKKATQEKKEHPEHPTEAKASAVTTDQMAQAIADYISSDSELKGGFFL